MKILATALLPILLLGAAAGCDDSGTMTVLFTSDTQGHLVPSG